MTVSPQKSYSDGVAVGLPLGMHYRILEKTVRNM
jgi:hypothetical protein